MGNAMESIFSNCAGGRLPAAGIGRSGEVFSEFTPYNPHDTRDPKCLAAPGDGATSGLSDHAWFGAGTGDPPTFVTTGEIVKLACFVPGVQAPHSTSGLCPDTIRKLRGLCLLLPPVHSRSTSRSHG